eukprot:80135-Pyramimonas_sp.AAC.1
MEAAAESALPVRSVIAKRPWIRTATLDLIEQRNTARAEGQFALEASLNKQIKSAAKRDRAEWLEKDLAENGWSAIKRLRRGESHQQQGRLQSMDGNLVDSSGRAEAMATYFQDAQWKRIPGAGEGVPSEPRLGPVIDIPTGEFSQKEFKKVLSRLRRGKASGPDNAPPDFWATLALNDTSLQLLLQ